MLSRGSKQSKFIQAFFLKKPGDQEDYSLKLAIHFLYQDLLSGTNHMQPNWHQTTPISGIAFRYPAGFDVRSNKFGFFTDWPLDEFPEKGPREYRIILIGGSGALGVGARTNEDMFYRRLEKALQEKFSSDGITIRVINLAVAGATVATQLRDLRAYARPLDRI